MYLYLRKRLTIPLLLFFLSIPVLLFFHLKGFVAHDEGWILNPALRLLHGEEVYRDFHFIYTPFTLFFASLIFSIFGESVFVARIAAASVAFLTLFLIYTLIKKATGEKTLGIYAASIFLVWGSLHINFIWPVMFAIPFSIAACFFILKAETTNNKVYYALSGAGMTLTFFSKQNFGVAMLLAVILSIILVNNEKVNKLSWFFVGAITTTIPFFLYFLLNNTLKDFALDMYYFMVIKTVFMGLQNTPILYPAPLLHQVLKTSLYLSPLLLAVAALFVCFKENKKILILPLFCSLFYVFGIRPTTDYTHLLPLVAVSGISVALLSASKKTPFLRFSGIFITILLLLLGVYDLLFRNYYRWDEPILQHNVQSQNPRLAIQTTQNAAQTISLLTHVINNNSQPKEYIFIYAYAPLYYFILDRKNPTRFDFFPPLTKNDEQEIINSLKSKPVRLVVTQHPLDTDQSLIGRYIIKNYSLLNKKRIYIWKKEINSQ